VHEFSGRRVAACDDRAVVEEAGGGEERRDVERCELSDRRPARDRDVPRGAGLGIETDEVLVAGDREHGSSGGGESRVGGHRSRQSVVVVDPRHDADGRCCRGEVAREHRDGVEGAAGVAHSPGGHESECGFDTHDAVEGGGHPPGTRGVGAEGDVRHPEGNGDGRA